MAFSRNIVRLLSTSRMPSLLLYKRDASPPSCAVMGLAEMLGLHMEYKEPDLLQSEHKTPEFRKINPMATIPTLKDGNFIISESHAIMKYLVEKYGADKRSALYPTEYEARAIVDERMYFNAGMFFIRLKVVALPTIRGKLKWPTPTQIADIEDAYSTVEAYLEKSTYIAGEHLTIADLCVGSTAAAIQGIHPLKEEKYPKTKKWLTLLEEEPSFKTITAGAEQLKHILKICWERNKRT